MTHKIPPETTAVVMPKVEATKPARVSPSLVSRHQGRLRELVNLKGQGNHSHHGTDKRNELAAIQQAIVTVAFKQR